MASINPSVLDCRNSPHVSGKTDNHCRLTITNITQTDGNQNQTTVSWKITVEGTPYSYLYALYVSLGGVTLYDHHTGGAILTSWRAGDVIASGTTTFNNNNDGSLTLSAYIKQMFYYGNGDTSRWNNPNMYQDNSTNMVCSSIPRASSISSSADFVKGDATTITVNRAHYNFTHTIDIYVGSTLIKSITGVGTSTTWTPSKSEVETMLNAGTSSTIYCTTYNGSTKIANATSRSGTAYNPTLSTIKDTPNITLGSSITVNVNRNKDFYTHSLKVKVGSTLIKTINDISTRTTLSFTQAEINTIYGLVKNSPTATLNLECITYIRGASAGSTPKSGTLTISSSGNEPTFTDWTYKGTNATANTILGTNQVLIQNYNGIEIICSKAVGKNEATIVKYQAIINGLIFETTNLTNRKITISNLNLSGANTCQVRAIDSRGFITTVTKSITFIAYSVPEIPTINMKRKNNYDTEVTLALIGNFSRLFYNNEVKNDVLNFKYRYKKTSDTNYNNWVDIPTSLIPNTKKNYYIDYTKGEVGLSATVIGDFDIEDTYTFQFQLKDKLNDLFFTAILVNGIPLIALRKGKVGINCVPKSDGTNGLYVNNAELNILNAESVKSPTLLNSWTNYGGDYDTAGYYKDKDRVFLQGLIKGGTVGAVAFTLPVGYRPAKRKIFVVNANNTFGRVDVLSNGNVYIDAMCSNSYVSLENINFRI